MKSFTLSAALKTIGDAAFSNCDALTEIVLPEGLETIGKLAFYYCHALASLSIPASVNAIGEYAFRQEPKNDFEEEDETTEEGPAAYVELEITVVPGSYADLYISGKLNEDESETESDKVQETESESETGTEESSGSEE